MTGPNDIAAAVAQGCGHYVFTPSPTTSELLTAIHAAIDKLSKHQNTTANAEAALIILRAAIEK